MGGALIGSKAENLLRLGKHGVRVPRGFVLDDSHYRLASTALGDLLVEAIPDSPRIGQLFAGLPLATSTLAALEAGLGALGGARRFAVRSSGRVWSAGRSVVEDGTTTALAGQFESFLGVVEEDIPSAVRACWASLFNQRSLQYFGADKDYVDGSAMAVVIQEMVFAESSAVMMTADPLGDGSTGGIEFTWGACEAIVSGRVSPDFAEFERRTGRITKQVLGSKTVCLKHEEPCNGLGSTSVEPNHIERRSAFSLTDNQLGELIRLGARIEAILAAPQDIEAVYADGYFTVTQARPVTVVPDNVAPYLVAAFQDKG